MCIFFSQIAKQGNRFYFLISCIWKKNIYHVLVTKVIVNVKQKVS